MLKYAANVLRLKQFVLYLHPKERKYNYRGIEIAVGDFYRHLQSKGIANIRLFSRCCSFQSTKLRKFIK